MPRPWAGDREHFLTSLYAPGFDCLPPRTAPVEDWRRWLDAPPIRPKPTSCWSPTGDFVIPGGSCVGIGFQF